MRRVLACTATAVVALAGAGIGPTRGDTRSPHVAAWVYDTHLWPPARMDGELARLPGDARRLYVSVESGHRLVLEDAAATARLGHLLDVAHGRGLEVEAMLLQGPEWAGDAEGAVRRIEAAYDGQGNAYLVTSYDAASGGSVVNQVQRGFNGLGQLTTEWQAHGGAVNTSTSPKVQYAYAEMPSGANHSRLTSMTYPSGYVLTGNYSSGLNDSIGRLSSLSDTSGTVET